MIRESVIDSTLNRLSAALGKHVIIRPPATAEEIAALERLVGPIPRELSIFLLTCNGLRIAVDEPAGGPEWHLWHTQEIGSSILHSFGWSMPPGLTPFRGDPSSVRDALVAGHGPAESAVVRWDPWTRGTELLASGFGCYLQAWAQCMMERFDQKGRGRTRIEKAAFDADYISRTDPAVSALKEQPGIAEWLEELDQVPAGGDDFE